MNGDAPDDFKMTEIGPIPEDWGIGKLGDLVDVFDKLRVPVREEDRVRQKKVYPYCGANGVIDYVEDFLFDGEYLLVAEDGGHWGKLEQSSYIMTGRFWVNNHAHVLRAIPKKASNHFLMYALNHQDLSGNVGGDARGKVNQGILKNVKVPLPPHREQERITRVLNSTQQAVNKSRAVLSATRELKKSLIRHLFTYGPVPLADAASIQLAETDIGIVPEDWRIVTLGECLLGSQYGISLRGSSSGTYPILRMNNLADGRLDVSDLQYVVLDEKRLQQYRLSHGDLLFNRTNSYDLVGKTSLFDLGGDFVFASYLVRLVTDKNQLLPEFLNYYVNWEATQARMKHLASRGVSQSNISASKLKTLRVCVPPMEDQKKTVGFLRKLDDELRVIEDEVQAQGNLFFALLDNLMKGKLRINNLEVPT